MIIFFKIHYITLFLNGMFQLNIVTSLSPALLPNLFDLVGAMEKYHPRVTLQYQLAR